MIRRGGWLVASICPASDTEARRPDDNGRRSQPDREYQSNDASGWLPGIWRADMVQADVIAEPRLLREAHLTIAPIDSPRAEESGLTPLPSPDDIVVIIPAYNE